jgi:hypothetical protein
MALQAATNCWTDQEDRLRESLSNRAQFQPWTSTASATLAKARIHVETPPEPASKDKYTEAEVAAMLPMAIIMDAEDAGQSWKRMCHGVGQFYTNNGTKYIQFMARLDLTSESTQEQVRRFKNVVGKIILEMNDQSGGDATADYVEVNLVERVQLAKQEHRSTLGDAIQVTFGFLFDEGGDGGAQ